MSTQGVCQQLYLQQIPIPNSFKRADGIGTFVLNMDTVACAKYYEYLNVLTSHYYITMNTK